MVGGIPKETYTYDSLNQLTSLTVLNGSTYSYTYDNGGNILSKTVDGVTTNYTYGDSTWKDLLTAYNGNAITYDTIGNPLTYYDGKTFTWNGRQLDAVGGNTNVTYAYNADGIRIKKTVHGMPTYYYVNGSQILKLVTGYGAEVPFEYDASGKLVSMTYEGNAYYYVHNLQGDVIGLTDSSGALVVEYTYDPWGKQLSCTGSKATSVGSMNPFRYRGYFYDSETGFYYLNSRYYDPNTGRFLNADGVIGINSGVASYNLFAYCSNEPINHYDPSGYRTFECCPHGNCPYCSQGTTAGSSSSGVGGTTDFWSENFGVHQYTTTFKVEELEYFNLFFFNVTAVTGVSHDETTYGGEKTFTAYHNLSDGNAGIKGNFGNISGSVGVGGDTIFYESVTYAHQGKTYTLTYKDNVICPNWTIAYSDGETTTAVTVKIDKIFLAFAVVAPYYVQNYMQNRNPSSCPQRQPQVCWGR